MTTDTSKHGLSTVHSTSCGTVLTAAAERKYRGAWPLCGPEEAKALLHK